MENYTITRKEVQLIDDMILKLDELAALTIICSSAFIPKDSFGNVKPRDVHESLNNISSQIREISKDANVLMAAIYGSRSEKEGAVND